MPLDDLSLGLSLPTLGARVSRKKKPAESKPDERRSLLGRLGDSALSGLSMVGNVLDLPGSMVRDTLGGQNPFDQLLSPHSDRNRLTGRDLNRKYGLAGQQDTWGNWGGGLATEVLTDPLTYLTFGAGALSKGGQVAKSAGLLDDVGRVAAKKANVEASTMGARTARTTSTLRDVIKDGGMEAARKARTAAKGMGHKLRDIADEPLGGLASVGLPFGQQKVLGTGARGQAIAKGLDTAGRAVRYAKIPGTEFQPLNTVARMFDARLKDTTTPEVQSAAKGLHNAEIGNQAKVGLNITHRLRQLDDIGLGKQGDSVKLREMLTNPAVGANLSPAAESLKTGLIRSQGNRGASRRFKKQSLATIDQWLNNKLINEQDAQALGRMVEYRGLDAGAGAAEPIIKQIRGDLEKGRQGSQKLGNAADRLTDTQNAYFPAGMTEGLALSGKKAEEIMGTGHANREQRRLFTRDIRDRENTLNKIAADPVLNRLIDDRGADIKTISSYLKRTYRTIPKTFTDEYGKKASRFDALAGWYSGMPKELREAGIYGNHPLHDLGKQQLRVHDSDSAAKAVFSFLSQPGILKPASSAARNEGFTTVSEVFRQLDLNEGDAAGGALKSLADMQKQIAINPDLGKQLIAKPMADDLTRLLKGYTSPEPTSEFLKVFDSTTNLTKGFLTGPWPAFHTRNLFSGQWQNFIAGMFSPGSVRDAHIVIRGGELKGAASIPALQNLAKERGIASLDDPTATKLLRDLAYAYRITGKGELDNAIGKLPGDPGTIDAIRAGLPGEVPQNFRNVFKGATANPLDVRGVGGRTESNFAPAKAGDAIGGYIEGLNRLSPFIEQLKKGVDPAEAAKKIGAAQVLYQNKYYSKTEQEVLKRLFPFYSYTSRQIPFTLKQLSEKPGGRLAQTIRASNRARNPDEFTPDYVSETASIPLGKAADGTARYLTGLGLSMEDPLSLVGGPRSAGLELLSRMNPIIKGPLEYATGESFFQKGPEGGRNLSDMDPTIGRLLANVTGSKQPVKVPFGQELDTLVNNSPLSRVASTARVLTDTRKGTAGKLANLGTGFKVSDISPGAQDAVLRERAQALEKKLGFNEFTRLHLPVEERASMSPLEQQMSDELLRLDRELALRAKKRKADRQKSNNR